jgi:hypothetical protein
MRKRLIIASLIIILILLIGVFVGLREEKDEPVKPQPLPELNISKQVESRFVIGTTLKESDFSFPKNLSVILSEPKPPYTEPEAKEVAANLGFTAEPIAADDLFEGKTYIWPGGEAGLVIYSKSRRVEYSLNESPAFINKQLSNKALIKISKDFLAESSLASPDEVEFSFFTFYEKERGGRHGFPFSTKEKASIYQVNFAPIKSEVKLLTLDPASSPIYVWLLPDGTVIKAVVSDLGKLSFSDEKYTLKDYNSFIQSLQSSVFMSLDDGSILLPTLPKNSLRRVTISEVELAYFVDPDAKTFQPVFLLKGKANIKDYPEEVNALLYLPAIKTP